MTLSTSAPHACAATSRHQPVCVKCNLGVSRARPRAATPIVASGLSLSGGVSQNVRKLIARRASQFTLSHRFNHRPGIF